MNLIKLFIDVVLHLDSYLRSMATDFGPWVYAILFVVVFCETGLVVTPFLPGDSILFMLGTLSALGIFGLAPSIIVLAAAAILGDTVNYQIGKAFGQRAFRKEEARFFKKENLEKAQAFYEKWGGFAIIMGRFMPIIRTFVPFVAGIGTMRYPKFLAYNVVGGIAWVSFFTLCGFFFGNIPLVKDNLTIVIYGIVAVSAIPAVVGAIKGWTAKKPGK